MHIYIIYCLQAYSQISNYVKSEKAPLQLSRATTGFLFGADWSLGLFHLHICLCWYTCANVCSCGETQGRRHGEGHLKTLRLYNPRATYITFPTLHFPCKEQWNLNGSIQSSAPAGIIWLRTQSRGKIREFWRKDIKIDRICFLIWGGNGRGGPNCTRVQMNCFFFFLQCKIEKMLAKLCFDRTAFNKIYLLTAETSVKSTRFHSDPNFFCALYCCSTNATH